VFSASQRLTLNTTKQNQLDGQMRNIIGENGGKDNVADDNDPQLENIFQKKMRRERRWNEDKIQIKNQKK
jgi:hypothetical protein